MTLATLALLICGAVASATDDTPPADRDADIFGESAAPASSDTTTRSDTGDRLVAQTAAEDDKLTLGSRMYLRLDYAASVRGRALTQPFSSPSLLDVYLDARPNERIRAFANGRLLYDFTAAGAETRAQLNELWMKFDVGRVLFLTAGTQPVRGGTGRFWNPTDFLNQQRKDPLAAFDERLGVTMVKAHVPLEGLGTNLYAIANLDGATRPDNVGGALRAEMVLGPSELSLSIGKRQGDAWRLGGDLSAGAGPFDLKAEVALLHGVGAPYYRGRFDPARWSLPTAESRANEWIPQAVVGLEWGINYTDEDAVYLGAEYFYNGFGYTSARKYPWLLYNHAFVPFYTGEQYAAAYVTLPDPGRLRDTTFIVSTLGNLSDRSFVSRFDYRVRVLTYLDLVTFVSVHYGKIGEFHYGLEVAAVPAVPELAAGMHIPQPFIDAGLGLQLKF
ncbi:MAG: hypothetical protein AAB426_12995 [Myxococcota bacterium]